MKKILIFLCCIIFCVALVVPASAASLSEQYGIPNPNSVWTDNSAYPYAFIVSNDVSYSLYLYTEKVHGNISGNFSVPSGYRRYDLSNGFWNVAVENGGSVSNVRVTNLVWASYDINAYETDYDGDGKKDFGAYYYYNPDFFPSPLWELPQTLTTETMKTTLPALGGTMSILTLSGVGLMACLVVLSLFGKRSLISRG